MLIAVLSDSHDHIANLRKAVTIANARGAMLLLHCGDLISPFMLDELAAFRGPTHLVYGNNMGDMYLIGRYCTDRFPTITHHGIKGVVEADGKRIALHHYPELAHGLAFSGHFDIVCCGHNHTYRVGQIGNCLLVNPGELLGKDGQPTFCLLDTTSLTSEKVKVGSSLFL